MKRALILVTSLLAYSTAVHAVVVASGASNTTAPAGQPYFNHIGIVNGSSGIYLGNRWMLTAAHVAQVLPTGAISLAGNSYSAEEDTFQHISNPVGFGLTAITDLVLFRLTTDPGLPSLNISSASPTVGADVMMIGRGRDQQASRTYWDVEVIDGPSNDVWTTVPAGGHDREGYQTLNSRTIRWGENNVAATGVPQYYNAGSPTGMVDVISFTTSFDLDGKTHEAQGINGDSGGAVFVDDGGTWTLAGVMLTIDTYENQPLTTAIFGNETVMADLSFYRSQILSVIPEPSSSLLCLLGSLLVIVRRQR